MPPWITRLLPRSLISRVFSLYALSLFGFVGCALGLFYRYQFQHELERTALRAEALVHVMTPTIAEGAVIGDYDIIRRTLERALHDSDFSSAAFIDLKGGRVLADNRESTPIDAPRWLHRIVSAHLNDTNQPIGVGGHDYGVLRLSIATDRVAAGLWSQALAAMAVAMTGFLCGLVLIGLPLKHWFGNIGRLQSMEEQMRSGGRRGDIAIPEDAPIEFKRTFDILSRAAADLHMQRAQAAVTLQAIGDAVFTLDLQGRVVFANPATASLGFDPDQLLGRGMAALMPALFDDPAACVPWHARRVTLNAADGRSLVLDTTLSPISDADGALCGHVLACRDITRQHALDLQLQDELRAREATLTSLRQVLQGLVPHSGAAKGGDIEAISTMISGLVLQLQEHSLQLRSIFELSPDGFVSFGSDWAVTYASPGFTALTGLDVSEVLGLDQREFATQLAARCSIAGSGDIHGLLGVRTQAETAAKMTMTLERPTRRTLEVSIRDGDGQAISRIVHMRDVTHASEVDQMKSEFLSAAAHELRTPMTSIFGFVELMLTRQMTPERQKDVLETVYRQSKLMIAIINELLDLARIEARRGKDFVIESVDLAELIHRVVDDFRPPAGRQPPLLRIEGAARVRADRSKLIQALSNIVSNAYKYSPGGGDVQVSLLHRPHGEGEQWGIAVRDHGIGMTAEQLARVGERFYRADESGTIPGTGLGMSLVKEIVALLGGQLDLDSLPGDGTTATIWLPPMMEPRLAMQGDELSESARA